MTGRAMDAGTVSTIPIARSKKLIAVMVYLIYAAVVIRTLTNGNVRPRLPIYLTLEFLYLLLLTLALWRPPRRVLWQHGYFVFQSLLVQGLVAMRPRFDFIVVLNVLLSFLAVSIFIGRARWIWVAVLALLTCVPLMIGLGALQGLALALMPMTIGIVFAVYVVVTQEIEAGLKKRAALLVELQEANRRLTVYAGEVEELSAIQERNQLARELHDSVSQTIFSITLHTRAAQLMLERQPDQLQPQLERLRSLSQTALAEMRGLILHLLPIESESAGRPTP
jgi:signal transduction histidine kinase